MNSTEIKSPEKEKIAEICRSLSDKSELSQIISSEPLETESFYSDKKDLRHFPSELFDYDFSTPAQLKSILKGMWEFQNCQYMNQFATVSAIAAFKNKSEEDVEKGIKSFIYQF